MQSTESIIQTDIIFVFSSMLCFISELFPEYPFQRSQTFWNFGNTSFCSFPFKALIPKSCNHSIQQKGFKQLLRLYCTKNYKNKYICNFKM
jgi:hypothetical protein